MVRRRIQNYQRKILLGIFTNDLEICRICAIFSPISNVQRVIGEMDLGKAVRFKSEQGENKKKNQHSTSFDVACGHSEIVPTLFQKTVTQRMEQALFSVVFHHGMDW